MPAGFIHRLGERILRKRMLYAIVFFHRLCFYGIIIPSLTLLQILQREIPAYTVAVVQGVFVVALFIITTRRILRGLLLVCRQR